MPSNFSSLANYITFRPLTREGTNFLKGIAILLIALHNYYRWTTPITGENEFEFSRLTTIKNYILVYSNPLELIHVFFNFLGHYGVQAFIVISAYGLTCSYNKKYPGYGKYLLHRIDKLYPSLWFAAVAFILFCILTTGQMISTETLKNIGIQLTLFANLFPGKAMAVSGPWWFWSFIFGFYLVFPGILWLYRRTGIKGLIGIVVFGYLFSILSYPSLRAINLNPYTMFAGHLPELCLGIFLADTKEVRFPWWIILLSFLVFAGGNWFAWLWPFANLGVSILLILLIGWMGRKWNSGFTSYRVITFIGSVSLYIFALQGFVRNPFLGLSGVFRSPVVSLFSGILFVVVITGLAWLMLSVENGTRQWISRSDLRSRIKKISLLFILSTVPFIVLVLAGENEDSGKKKRIEKIIFSSVNDFESPGEKYPERYSDSVFFQGKKSFELPYYDSFSPFLTADLGKIDLDGVYSVESSAMILTPDSLAKVVLVFEVWFTPNAQRVDWQQEILKPENIIPGKWTPCKYRYIIPKEYLNSNFSFKTYLWNHGNGRFYADDLKLEIIAGK